MHAQSDFGPPAPAWLPNSAKLFEIYVGRYFRSKFTLVAIFVEIFVFKWRGNLVAKAVRTEVYNGACVLPGEFDARGDCPPSRPPPTGLRGQPDRIECA